MESLILQFGAELILAGLGLAGLSCLLTLYLAYKIRQVHVTVYETGFKVSKISVGLTQNLQNLQLLEHELSLKRPLPLLRGWAASPDVLLVLARHIRVARPETIVECGSGVSTIVQAQALRLNGRGHVYSLDHDPAFAAQTREALAGFGLSEWATVLDAPLTQVEASGQDWRWYAIDRLPASLSIDLLFVDGPPVETPDSLSRYPAGPLLFPRLGSDASVFLDDADRPGEQSVLRRWAEEFPQLVQQRHFCEKGCFELRHRDPAAAVKPPRDAAPSSATPARQTATLAGSSA